LQCLQIWNMDCLEGQLDAIERALPDVKLITDLD
jgi:hypothetical protein